MVRPEQQYQKIKEVGAVVGFILKTLKNEIRPGICGKDLEKMAQQLMKEKRVKSSTLGYKGFPSYICISLNEELTHGIPDERIFRAGDLVSLDVACYKKDIRGAIHHADAALTTIVPGEKKQNYEKKQNLLNVTKGALQEAIAQIKPGVVITTQDIGAIIENYVHAQGYYVIKEYGGHGIGYLMHQEPFIPNYKIPKEISVEILPDTAICIEPLVQIGDAKIKLSTNR